MAELVVAMIIITIALLVLMMIQTSALVTVAEAGRKQQATAYGNEAMEQFRAMPWNILKKGMANNYLAASGGDPNVSGGVLTLEGVAENLIVAPPSGTGGAQDLSDPWPPLFDSTGSHLQIEQSPGNADILYEVRSYVVQGMGGIGTVGLVVQVKWTNIDSGEVGAQVFRSTAYAPIGGCGDLDTQPFLSSCEARLESAAGSGNIVVSSSSTKSELVGTNVVVSPTPIIPDSTEYEVVLKTSQTRATMTSQQVSLLEATGADGGVKTWGSGGVMLSENGFGSYPANFDSSPFIPPLSPDPLYLHRGMTAVSVVELTSPTVADFTFRFRGDANDSGGRDVEDWVTGGNCPMSGIPAGQPCALSQMDGGAETGVKWDAGMGDPPESKNYLYPYYRPAGASTDTTSTAWAARFIDVNGTSTTGCSTVSGSGCASAGANQSSEVIAFGKPASTLNPWMDGATAAAPDGIVIIYGYNDNVVVERGEDQKTSGPVSLMRGGHVHIWTSAGYSPAIPLDYNTSAYYDYNDIPDLVWTNNNGKIQISASTMVNISPSTVSQEGDPTCEDDVCRITATVGGITVRITYTINLIDIGVEYTTTVTGTINGSTAVAQFKEAPSA